MKCQGCGEARSVEFVQHAGRYACSTCRDWVNEPASDIPEFVLVYLESPFAGDTEANLAYARACMRDCIARGEAPFVSHALYTQPGVLDDGDAHERKMGMAAGFAWAAVAEKTVVYLDRGTSPGMQAGIDDARINNRSIEYRTLYAAENTHGRST